MEAQERLKSTMSADVKDARWALPQEAVEGHIAKALYRVELGTENFCRCVDGRYLENGELPPVARPGGTVGLYMALTAAARKLEEYGLKLDAQTRSALWEMVKKTTGADKNPEHVCFHTDGDHGQQPGAGCGHIMKALESPGDYGLAPEDMRHIVEKLSALVDEGARQDVLIGKHQEGAVLIVESNQYSVKPQVHIGDNISQVFVYQKTLDARLLENLALQLARHIQERGVNPDTVEELLERVEKEVLGASDVQLRATVERLAKDLPVYRAEIENNGTIWVSELSSDTAN